MTRQTVQSSGSQSNAEDRTICRNRRARHEYEIVEMIDCGIALVGSEVKSLRDHHATIEDAYAAVENGELWLLAADIAEYPQANVMNHDPRRPRKLLLRRKELRRLADKGSEAGFTLVPLELFFRRGLVKVRLALARGLRKFDKREKLKAATAGKAMREALKQRSRQ